MAFLRISPGVPIALFDEATEAADSPWRSSRPSTTRWADRAPNWALLEALPHPYADAMTALAQAPTIRRRVVAAWAAWDWGGAAFNAVITTFVFTVYLTGDRFVASDRSARFPPAFASAKSALSSGLGLGLAVAGLVVAVLAPVLGQRADATGRRRRGVAAGTAVVVAAMLAMSLVAAEPGWFVPGVVSSASARSPTRSRASTTTRCCSRSPRPARSAGQRRRLGVRLPRRHRAAARSST